MGESAIDTIISLLPETVIYDAACKYVIRLSREGRLCEAEYLYEKLYSLDARFESLAEAASCLVGRHIARKEINKAISIYERFPAGKENCGMVAEKLKSCHSLVFALIPDHLKKAHALWQENIFYDLNSCLKWQWAETGLALLECCYKNSLTEMASEIYRDIKRYGDCEASKPFLLEAERIMEKISG